MPHTHTLKFPPIDINKMLQTMIHHKIYPIYGISIYISQRVLQVLLFNRAIPQCKLQPTIARIYHLDRQTHLLIGIIDKQYKWKLKANNAMDLFHSKRGLFIKLWPSKVIPWIQRSNHNLTIKNHLAVRYSCEIPIPECSCMSTLVRIDNETIK